jgi:chaperonin cofactor prefoldin
MNIFNNFMNCIQKSFIPGNENNASCWERCADFLLVFPAYMWQNGHNFHNCCFGIICLSNKANKNNRIGSFIAIIFGSIICVLMNIFAVPFLILGGLMKVCVLGCDHDAAIHNEYEERRLLEKPILDQIEEFQTVMNKNNDTIKEYENILKEKQNFSYQLSNSNKARDEISIDAPEEFVKETAELLTSYKKKYANTLVITQKEMENYQIKINDLRQQNDEFLKEIIGLNEKLSSNI